MDIHLVNRAQAWLTLPGKEKTSEPGLQELGLIYSEITSTPVPDCIGCQFYPMSDTLQHFVNQSERLNNPTMSNYIWNSEYKGQKIVLSSLGLNITEDNLTDKSAEQAIKAGYGHVIKKKTTSEVKADNELEAAQAEYEKIFGEKPGNRKLETIQTAIAEHKAAEEYNSPTE